MTENPIKSVKRRFGLKHEPDIYMSCSIATENAFHWGVIRGTPHAVMIGDAFLFWVVCLADMEKLIKAGYEALPGLDWLYTENQQ